MTLAGRVFAITVLAAALAAVIARTLPIATFPALALAIGCAGAVSWWATQLATRSWSEVVRAVRDGVQSLRDHDVSISIAPVPRGELSELVRAYNSLGDVLRRERLGLYQRELLLDTVIQTTPLVMVLTNSSGRVIYSNSAARRLLLGGRKLEGLDFFNVLADSPAPLRDALSAGGDRLFTMEQEVYHLSQRRFHLNAQAHELILLKQLTRELAAQEVATWKKVTRVMAHELNNSLAPISSLVHSGRQLVGDDVALQRIFSTIADRAAHLVSFIDGYARFAKLPRPRPAPVSWHEFLTHLEGTMPFKVEGTLPQCHASFDAGQLEQVMINLLKNAAESGSPTQDIVVRVREERGGVVVEVADRGSGLTDNALRDALLPFYSTKPTGTGLGLTLCREIVEAHSGRLILANRPDGGARVSVWLPTP